MSADVDNAEPRLDQFAPALWSFSDDAARGEYEAAVEELREAMRVAKMQQVTIQVVEQPSADEVRGIARLVRGVQR